MNNQEEVALSRFLSSYWNQDAGSDSSVVDELINEATVSYVDECIGLIERFLSSPKSIEEKSRFIRNTAERNFDKSAEAAVTWLIGILDLIREARKVKFE